APKNRLWRVGFDVAHRVERCFDSFLIVCEIDELDDILTESICGNFVELAERAGQRRKRLLNLGEGVRGETRIHNDCGGQRNRVDREVCDGLSLTVFE